MVLLAFLAWVVWIIYVQFSCRQEVEIVTSKDQVQVLHVIDQLFGPKLYNRVAGRGQLNLKPRLKMNAPIISINLVPNPGHGTTVHVWMSQWKTRYGMANHAGWVWRKVRSLKKALAEPVSGTATPGPAPTTGSIHPPANAPLTPLPTDLNREQRPPPPQPPSSSAPPPPTNPSGSRWGKIPGTD